MNNENVYKKKKKQKKPVVLKLFLKIKTSKLGRIQEMNIFFW